MYRIIRRLFNATNTIQKLLVTLSRKKRIAFGIACILAALIVLVLSAYSVVSGVVGLGIGALTVWLSIWITQMHMAVQSVRKFIIVQTEANVVLAFISAAIIVSSIKIDIVAALPLFWFTYAILWIFTSLIVPERIAKVGNAVCSAICGLLSAALNVSEYVISMSDQAEQLWKSIELLRGAKNLVMIPLAVICASAAVFSGVKEYWRSKQPE